MLLAVLMTNTDESAFAQGHPKDGEKFATLIHKVRPDWQVRSFSVKDGDFPEDVTAFDGLMITGSPASVLERAPWMVRLQDEIRIAHAARVPIFGACFGHQAIALALGGKVEKNRAGWGFGLIDMVVEGPVPGFEPGNKFGQYGAHIDEVTELPPGARPIFSSAHCAHAGFAIGQSIYTTQNHPEMSPDFIAALVEEYASVLPPKAVHMARQSLGRKADTQRFASSIALFFEAAAAARLAD